MAGSHVGLKRITGAERKRIALRGLCFRRGCLELDGRLPFVGRLMTQPQNRSDASKSRPQEDVSTV